jgi:tRNA pseudouridine38-40 synthase
LTRYFIFISFKGTSYHGWQKQPGSVSVQELIENALSTIVREKIVSTGAGRTDAGVHALFFCAHFDSSASDLTERANLLFRLNRYLPSDISILGIKKVSPGSNARFSALSRTYRYHISRLKDPFAEDRSWYIHGFLDVVSMNAAAELLMKHSDFTSFSRLHSDNKTNICRVDYARWEQEQNDLVFTIKADRFLRNMVRAIVGTLIEVGKNKITPEEFENIIMAKNRSAAGTSAPAKGLILTDIQYPDGLFI